MLILLSGFFYVLGRAEPAFEIYETHASSKICRKTCRSGSLDKDLRRMIIPYVTAICRERFNQSEEARVEHVDARYFKYP